MRLPWPIRTIEVGIPTIKAQKQWPSIQMNFTDEDVATPS
jgi:hypothetical protein